MMNFRLLTTSSLAVFVLAGCAGVFGSIADTGNEIRIREENKPAANAKQEKYPITVRISGYTDARQVDSPRRAGISTSRILGLVGKDIMLDRDVAEVVAESARKRLSDDGIQVLPVGDASPAQFQLSGVVKELAIDVKDRDYVRIAIESTLTEVANSKVIWSGVVVEKAERYAGVSGNSKKDVADYLRKELGIAMGKTSESFRSVLMATRPDLFNLTAGSSVLPGVTVYANPTTGGASGVVPAASVAESGAQTGTLAVSSVPTRAKVYVDGVYFGLTPLRAEIGVGVHEVSVRSDGYQAASEKVSVRKGDSTELEMKLKRR